MEQVVELVVWCWHRHPIGNKNLTSKIWSNNEVDKSEHFQHGLLGKSCKLQFRHIFFLTLSSMLFFLHGAVTGNEPQREAEGIHDFGESRDPTGSI